METLAKIITDGLPPAGASRVVALDHVRQELESWSSALGAAVTTLDACAHAEEMKTLHAQDVAEGDATPASDSHFDEASADCECAFCTCTFAQREVDAVLADFKAAM